MKGKVLVAVAFSVASWASFHWHRSNEQSVDVHRHWDAKTSSQRMRVVEEESRAAVADRMNFPFLSAADAVAEGASPKKSAPEIASGPGMLSVRLVCYRARLKAETSLVLLLL